MQWVMLFVLMPDLNIEEPINEVHERMQTLFMEQFEIRDSDNYFYATYLVVRIQP